MVRGGCAVGAGGRAVGTGGRAVDTNFVIATFVGSDVQLLGLWKIVKLSYELGSSLH